MNISFDILRPEFLDSVLVLEQVSFRDSWNKNLYLSELSNPIAQYFVAMTQKKLLAYCGIQIVAGEGTITKIAVDSSFRRQGLGTAILNKALEYAQSQKAEFVTLEVRESNDSAIKLYKKNGFKVVGKRKNYYSDNREAALLMTRKF